MSTPIILDYQEFPIVRSGNKGESNYFKPIIEISISDKKKILCLLDSGADFSMSFKDIGKMFFGLDFHPDEQTPNLIAGFETCPDKDCSKHPHKAPVFRKPINFFINTKKIVLNVFWVDRGFNPEKEVLFILGRDFFEYFKITFDQREKRVYLYPYE